MSLDFSQEIILENDRAKLRPLEASDFDLLLPFSLNEPELWQYSLSPGNGAENLKVYLDTALSQRAQNLSYPFLIIDKTNNQVAGSTRFYDYQSRHNTVQLGYTWMGKKFQGTGLNKNNKYLMLLHAFENWGLERVEFRADYNNKRSIAAMKSIGCTEEGILRSNCAGLTGRRDSIVLSILKTEWETGIGAKLKAKIS